MNKQQFDEAIELAGEPEFTLNGETIDSSDVFKTYNAKIWKEANVIKNRRQAGNNGVKEIVKAGIANELLSKEEALELILMGSKEEVNAIKEQLPEVEKEAEPNDDDVSQAIKNAQEGRGQSA